MNNTIEEINNTIDTAEERRKSTRTRKTSKSFLQRNFNLSDENDSNDSEFENELAIIEQNLRKSPKTSKKRKLSDITSSSPQPMMPALCCDPIIDFENIDKKRKKDSSPKKIKFMGNIEYYDENEQKKSELFYFKPYRNSGYSFETDRFSINNFGLGDHLFFFLKKNNNKLFDLDFKIYPTENKLEILDDILQVFPNKNSDINNNNSNVNDSIENYIKKDDFKYPDVDLIFSSIKENHLQLVFRDVNTKIPFCTFNIQTIM